MLLEPVELRDPSSAGDVHFIAVGGAGMSGVAALYAGRGIVVTGCDRADSESLAALRQLGVRTSLGHDPSHLEGAGAVVVSSAIRADNPELRAAVELGLPVWHRSTALAALMLGRDGVAVAGTHGKTTTSGMIAVMLAAAGLDPSYVIGSPLADTGLAAHEGQGAAFVVEADESDGSFRQYPARVTVVTNIEADHLDNWGTPEHYAAGFDQFARGAGVRCVVANADDPGSAALLAGLRAEGRRVLAYGESPAADVRLLDLSYEGLSASATITHGAFEGVLRLRVPGRYNLHNAAAAFAVGLELGGDPAALLTGAAAFAGTLRRFQPVAEVAGVRIFDDYAHHPTEVTETLRAARTAAGKGRVVACFQPHLYSRTRDFAAEFGQALALADQSVVLDVYGAREDPIPGVSGRLIEAAVVAAGGRVTYVADLAAAPTLVAALVRPGDLLLTIGAGNVTELGPRIADAISEAGL